MLLHFFDIYLYVAFDVCKQSPSLSINRLSTYWSQSEASYHTWLFDWLQQSMTIPEFLLPRKQNMTSRFTAKQQSFSTLLFRLHAESLVPIFDALKPRPPPAALGASLECVTAADGVSDRSRKFF